jgi:hypothetical protein
VTRAAGKSPRRSAEPPPACDTALGAAQTSAQNPEQLGVAFHEPAKVYWQVLNQEVQKTCVRPSASTADRQLVGKVADRRGILRTKGQRWQILPGRGVSVKFVSGPVRQPGPVTVRPPSTASSNITPL